MPDRWDPLADLFEAHPSVDGDGWVVGDDTGPLPRVRCLPRPPWWLMAAVTVLLSLVTAVVLAPPVSGTPSGVATASALPDLTTRTDILCRCGTRY